MWTNLFKEIEINNGCVLPWPAQPPSHAFPCCWWAAEGIEVTGGYRSFWVGTTLECFARCTVNVALLRFVDSLICSRPVQGPKCTYFTDLRKSIRRRQFDEASPSLRTAPIPTRLVPIAYCSSFALIYSKHFWGSMPLYKPSCGSLSSSGEWGMHVRRSTPSPPSLP